MKWYDPKEAPFKTYGLAFFEKEKLYRRLSKNPPKPLPSAVNMLSEWPAGGQVRFRGKFKKMELTAKFKSVDFAGHMTPAGHSGFDCYLKRPDIDREPIYYSTVLPENSAEFTGTAVNIPEAAEFEVILNLPLYNDLIEFSLGFDDDAVIGEGMPFGNSGRIVVYGSSIDQGGCANRPGMAYTNILSRWLDTEFINLGFSGNGKAEGEVAYAVREVDGVKMFIISTAANCPDAKWLADRLPGFIEVLREKYPTVPILIWQVADISKLILDKKLHDTVYAKLAVEEETYRTRKAMGDENIYIARMDYSEDFMGHELSREVTVDGTHPTDLGFMLTAKKLYPIILNILGK